MTPDGFLAAVKDKDFAKIFPFMEDVAALSQLLDAGLDVNTRVNANMSLLQSVLQDRHLEAVRLLVDRGADLCATDSQKTTVLHGAASLGLNELIEACIAAGANVNALSKWNGTPLHSAACSGNSETVALLLEHGARTNPVNSDGHTPYQAVSAELELCGADSENDRERRSQLKKVLVQFGDDQGGTPDAVDTAIAALKSAVAQLVEDEDLTLDACIVDGGFVGLNTQANLQQTTGSDASPDDLRRARRSCGDFSHAELFELVDFEIYDEHYNLDEDAQKNSAYSKVVNEFLERLRKAKDDVFAGVSLSDDFLIDASGHEY